MSVKWGFLRLNKESVKHCVIIYLASFPRSGNTFARQLVFHYLGRVSSSVYNEFMDGKDFISGESFELDEDPRFNLVSGANHKPYRILANASLPLLTPDFRKSLAEEDEIYFVKTHEFPFDAYFDGEYVTRLVRHPGAALWSYYHYFLKVEQTLTTVEEIIQSTVGIPWTAYTNAWLGVEQTLQNRYIKIKYEDLVQSEQALITKIQQWTGIPLKQPFGTFPDFQHWHQQFPNFYRSGKVDEWKNKLTPEQLILLYQQHSEAAAKEGYTFDFAPLPSAVDYETRSQLARLGMADVANIPKVDDAGEIIENGALRYQVMFNGVKVPADSYYGPWHSELIRQCQGHHEPQEEAIFDSIVNQAPNGAVMMELGSYWAFYSTWFLSRVPRSRAILVEPDPQNITVSLATLLLNDRRAAVELCAVGERGDDLDRFALGAAPTANFEAPLRSVDELMRMHSVDRLYVLHSDTQGAELAMLEGAAEALTNQRVDYVVISTHSNDLHHACLTQLRMYNYRILAEHDLFESYTYDGLIVACSGQMVDAPVVKIHKRTAAEWTWEEAVSAWADNEQKLKRHFALLEQTLSPYAFRHVSMERGRLIEENETLRQELAQLQPLVSQNDQLIQENDALKITLAELRQALDDQLQDLRSRKISRIMKFLGKPIV